jgi:hypothetical protein
MVIPSFLFDTIGNQGGKIRTEAIYLLLGNPL